MLTNLVEDGTLKCCQYWPDSPTHTDTTVDQSKLSTTNSTQRFGNLLVQSVDIIPYAHFTVRQFQLTEMTTGVIQNVMQYHFHSWISPDEKVRENKLNGSVGSKLQPGGDEWQRHLDTPLGNLFTKSSNMGGTFDRLAFIEFYYRVKTASRPEDGPVLVHCGTGLNRTGLYIAFDSLLQQATHERVVGVARFCASLSKSRANMFRSTQHYVLLYDLLFEALLAGHSIVDLDVLSTYRILNQKNPKLGRSYLWEQWSLLHMYTPVPDPSTDLRSALVATNIQRNRFPKVYDLLPPERWRPKFRSALNLPDWTGYINAVYVDGSALRDDIILTQTPFIHTVDEFWLLIDEEKVSCIIDMEPFGYGTSSAVRYWPLKTDENSNAPLFGDPCDQQPEPQTDDSNCEVSEDHVRSAWCSVAGGLMEICQIGSLTPVRLDSSARKKGTNHGIYRRRLLLRTRTNGGAREKSKAREVLVFHFACEWNNSNQVCLV
ncbi:unnamed protein product [Echinostoma caproni]|uniref:protein-tyrosine-phosphatase n=1 Tax=Echinostoma caproni TaxID=27848 RepID=A0A183AN21_9TREM|nr:unnamed protein product [Echinostoma caproni]